ncbi:hypothetical protein PVAND_001559 [Polypedilum vanderplanki]|uniref:ZAD domain-containing protein n=1 Tax=Polypedilum vanderplanki TaxID=319348 RepID=A0A9J6BPK4_POLVA|nr:hypothetical protein PVAND_001559 [Polypedilum vanderplanki]
MQSELLRIESIYEEKTCTTCGRLSVDQYTNILNNFIKYKNELVPFIEIIRITLDFEPTPANYSMEICNFCKLKLQEFYIFKMRSIEARINLTERIIENSQQKLMQLENNDPFIYNTVQIVSEYIKNNSVKCIQVEETEGKILIISPSSQTNQGTIQCENKEEPLVNEFEKDECEETEFINEEILDENLMEYEDELDNDNLNDFKPSNVRRPRHADEWKCNKRKKLRNSGQAYINTKGNLVQGRVMKPACSNCRNRCNEKLTEEERQMNFNKFWALGEVVEQRKFIYNHIISKKPSRRKTVESNRSVTLEFYLDKYDSKEESVHVCKKMFKNTLAISNQVIQGVMKKYASSNFIDSRGKHERKLTEAQELAKEHVQQFPFFYVEQTMTKVQLYNMYVEQCKEKNIIPIKESNYREIFDKFNSNSFLKTERILCKQCHKYFKATDEERVALQKEHNEHIIVDKKCRDRALGRIRHKRSIERRKAEKLKAATE